MTAPHELFDLTGAPGFLGYSERLEVGLTGSSASRSPSELTSSQNYSAFGR
jgi:hypothetical protein